MNKVMLKIIKILAIVLVISICIVIVDKIEDIIPDKGTFHELVLEDFKDNIKFGYMNISRESSQGRDMREVKDLDKTSKFVDYVRGLKIKEVSEIPIPKGKEYEAEYLIHINSIDGMSDSITLRVYPSNHIRIRKKFTTKDLLNRTYNKRISKNYKITNNNNFIEYIENELPSIPKDEGSFNDIVMAIHKEQNFNKFNIEKNKKRRIIKKYNNNKEKTKNFLNYFKKLDIKRIEPYEIPDEVPTKTLYEINFTKDDTYSKIKIDIFSEKYFWVLNSITMDKTTKDYVTTYDEISISETYKINDKKQKLNLDYIEEVFNSLSLDSN